jgi:hypothetical protein
MQQFSFRRFLSVAVGMLSVGLVLTIAVSTPSFAQGPKVNAAPDSAKALIGSWEGSYVSDHAPSGAMKLVIGKDSVLKVSSLAMAMGNDMPVISTRNFAVSPTDISWTQDMMGMTCEATAILKNGQMKGTIVCGHGSVTFTLNKS